MMIFRSFICGPLVILAALLSPLSLAADSVNGNDDYIILPGDLLRVQVFQEEDLTREVRVTQSSSITLPLIGELDVAGLTSREVQDLIRDLYNRDYLVNPQVTLGVLEYAQRTVNVIGAVNNPGAIAFPQEQGLTVLEAITRAGGFNRYADRRKVRVSRTSENGQRIMKVINADNLMNGGNNAAWALQRDDVIFVPERIL